MIMMIIIILIYMSTINNEKKKILIAITGSIAAIKILELINLLQDNFDIKIIISDNVHHY